MDVDKGGGGVAWGSSPPSFWQSLKNIIKTVFNKVYCIKNVQTLLSLQDTEAIWENQKFQHFLEGMSPDSPRMHWHALHSAKFSKPLHSEKVVYAHVVWCMTTLFIKGYVVFIVDKHSLSTNKYKKLHHITTGLCLWMIPRSIMN